VKYDSPIRDHSHSGRAAGPETFLFTFVVCYAITHLYVWCVHRGRDHSHSGHDSGRDAPRGGWQIQGLEYQAAEPIFRLTELYVYIYKYQYVYIPHLCVIHTNIYKSKGSNTKLLSQSLGGLNRICTYKYIHTYVYTTHLQKYTYTHIYIYIYR